MINPQWLELPMSLTNFYGPKDIRANEIRLYINKAIKAFLNYAKSKVEDNIGITPLKMQRSTDKRPRGKSRIVG